MDRLFPQGPHLSLDLPRVPSLLCPRLGRVPQGSPISPLLFVIYVSSLHLEIPRSLIISYVDDFAVTVASPSYRTNVRLLQKSFSALKRKASPINISFSVPKAELIHWRTTRSNEPPCSLPVQLEDQLFYPQPCLKWVGFIFTPAFDPRSHFSRRYTLANAALATVRRLSVRREPISKSCEITHADNLNHRRRLSRKAQ